MNLTFDLLGKIRNTRLPHAQCLKPLYEAVSNSIQSIEEAKETNGSIVVEIDRGAQQSLAGDPKLTEPIRSFTIIDNGVGFNEDNFKSFTTSDSSYKADRGCKGVGRFVWLKAFHSVKVKSRYKDQGDWRERKFKFRLTQAGIEDEESGATEAQGRETRVTLYGFRDGYKDNCPKHAATIAQRLVEHCLAYFIQKKPPTIILREADGEEISCNILFEQMRFSKKSDAFKVGEHSFKLVHLLVPAMQEQSHRLHLCADGWPVKRESVSGRIAELEANSSPIRNPESHRQLFYLGLLSGELLDDTVSAERIDFSLSEEGDMFGGISLRQINEAAAKRIRTYLDPHLTEVKAARDEQVRRHVRRESPQYRPLLKHRPSLISEIAPNLSQEKLELKLYEANQQYNKELKERYQELLSQHDDQAVELEEHHQRVEEFLKEWNEEGMAKLAWHVAHRRATLAFLDQELGLDEEGKYRLENAIHRVIFPLKRTSDDVQWDQQNLWVLDEKLVYHHYLASDKEFRSISPVDVRDRQRPDVLVFNNPISVVDSEPPFGSVVIFEFKRPMRKDYTESDNPINQVYGYIRKIQAGDALDRNGRPVKIRPDTPFTAYIVCDVTDRLREMAENAGLRPTPDGEGFFGFHEKLRAYVEVVSFDKMISDAKKRNMVLFDLLGFRLHDNSVAEIHEDVHSRKAS